MSLINSLWKAINTISLKTYYLFHVSNNLPQFLILSPIIVLFVSIKDFLKLILNFKIFQNLFKIFFDPTISLKILLYFGIKIETTFNEFKNF